ncbi:hypothetical protein A2971_01350 [Candidatus Gottesmanbacteria bacterium RIFCSPLOWO2_01_FULL_46_21]|uniref:Ribonuclease VapC n=1 Tax=Candidatus Gottesmanbacteria bacterium RIFCSPLOWO2_01_FULL_46_21 TaxID=1798393 RepID=A0A1F6AYT6_9BACT|nr:MAG: hypothetical protein A2971_01350 [Candidatus Gottesmanbacteria bacterium RIFCSPLOWO2_01_FULL_46_21]
MTHLLDTDCIINHLRGRTEIIPESDKTFAMSVVTMGELLYGAERSDNPKKTRAAISIFQSEFQVSIMDITEQIVARYASIKAALSKRGVLIEDFDLLIAATAITHNLTLVTANTKHFKRIKGLLLA